MRRMRYMTESTRARLGERIRQARQESGLSHDRLGAKVGTSRQHLIKLEKGLHAPSENMLGRIAAATDRDVEWFTAEADGSAKEEPSADMVAQLFQRMVDKAVAAHFAAEDRRVTREIERAAEQRRSA